MLLITAEIRPLLHRSPTARPREDADVVMAAPADLRDVAEGPIAVVVKQDTWLFVVAAEMLAIHFRVDVPVHQEQIGPTVVIEIEEHRSPSEILRVQARDLPQS